MPRVFYPYVAMPEKPRIAKALLDELGWEPVLWVAYPDQQEPVRSLFPEAHFQTIADAFYGRPFPAVNTQSPHVPDADMWLRLQAQVPAMLAMMNYYGPPEVFLYAERERFARNLLLQWNELISVLKPDIVFFEEAPHAPHTWALYALCLEYGIPTPFFMPTAIPTFSVLKDRVDGPPLGVMEKLAEFRSTHADREIHPDVRRAVALLAEGETFRHWYMDAQEAVEQAADEVDEDPVEREAVATGVARYIAERIVNVRQWPHYMRTLASIPAARRRQAQIEEPSALDQPTPGILLKHPGRPLGDPPMTLREYYAYKEESASRKAALKQDYLARCSEPDTESDSYVFMALHYQPERTTDSDGGAYRDQHLAAATVHEALPDGWLLYVKEHPSQFAAALHGDKGRTSDLYDDLQALKSVRLIDPDYPSKELATHAKAVVTISGTIAWEAALNGKLALAFGYPWYEGCPGVRMIRGLDDAQLALAEAEAGARATEEELTLFLQAFSAAAYRVDLGAWLKEAPEVSMDDQIAGMLRALGRWTSSS